MAMMAMIPTTDTDARVAIRALFGALVACGMAVCVIVTVGVDTVVAVREGIETALANPFVIDGRVLD